MRSIYRFLTMLPVLTALVSLAPAMEPPTAVDLESFAKNPEDFQRRLERARRYGNHKPKPWVVERTAVKLQAIAEGKDLHMLPPPAWRGMPTKGNNNILVFLIDFPDEAHVNSFETITNKLFGAGIPSDFPLESLTKFYERSSYGMLRLRGTVLGWYRMTHTRDWYTTTYGTGNEANYAIIKEVSDHFDASVDYRQFDNNSDGKIDYFAVLWAGPDDGWGNFWWGYQSELEQNLTHDGVQFESFSWQWESNVNHSPYRSDFTPDVIIHETGHALGLPDYYDYDDTEGVSGGVGGMDMMDSGTVDHNCFSKFMLEWVTPAVVLGSVEDFPLRAAADYPECVALAKGYRGASAFAEYFMVQNRTKANNDAKLPGAGLAIWHIDARLDASGRDFEYNNSYTEHKLLRLMEADGLEEIEAGMDADAGDFYVAGSVFTPESMPNSLSYTGLSTEVRVTDISAPGTTMTADFSAEDNAPTLDPFPVYVIEGTTTNVAISFIRAPTTNVTLTVAWYAGSSNVYVEGNTSFTFTPSDYNVPQMLVFGALSDADQTNDAAIFRMISYGASAQGYQFVVRQMDRDDVVPPACAITAFANAERNRVYVDFMFDEAVFGFEASDIVATNNILGGAVLEEVFDVGGSNQFFRAVFACADTKGAITLTVPAGSLTDQSGNFNPNPEYGFVFVIPWAKSDFFDDFEGESTSWTASTNAFEAVTTDGWRWGPPVFDWDWWFGPYMAASGTRCWGTMDGPYDPFLDAWVRSPTISVGTHPLLTFQLWMNFVGMGYVEVNGGTGWRTVAGFTSTGWNWVEQKVALDNDEFGNRPIQIRFRAVDSPMYIDDVRVESQRGPSVWLVSGSPTQGTTGTTVAVAFQVYNSTPSALTGVVGEVTCADAGVTIGDGAVAYGTLPPGAVASGAGTVPVALAADGSLGSETIQLYHQSKVDGVALASDIVPFLVNGSVSVPATNLLTVSAAGGVYNWLGQRLPGNGSSTSCLFQVLYAGTNGVPEAPTATGKATGDDQILYSSDLNQPWGRFGEGANVAPDIGTFLKTFSHGLPAGAWVYVRAWDASTFSASVAYGDSAPYTLQAAAVQSRDFASWTVNRPSNSTRDSNGDSIPDGWSVLYGLDPRLPIAPLPTGVTESRAITDFSYPNRVVVSTNFVFVADTENNRVQVWDRALTNRLCVFGAPAALEFSKPSGIAVSRDGARVAVADTLNNRVRLFSVSASTGVIVPQFAFGSAGSWSGQFNSPMAVAFDGSGDIYVADSKAVGVGNNRVQVFNSNGVHQLTFGSAGENDGEFGRALGIGVQADGTVCVADGSNHRVQAFGAGGTFAWKSGTNGSASGQFNWVWDAQPGVGNRLYVTDLYNKRIQVLGTGSAPAVAVEGMVTNAGALGVFNLPRSAAPAPDDHVLYVADTYNHRVLRLRITLDVDEDGMDDVWESLHNVTDALEDSDGDGVSNIGEYRIGTDPHNPDCNGNGLYDGDELLAGLDPNAPGGPITIRIMNFGLVPPVLGWLADSGDICRVQWSTNLLGTNWVDSTTVTSSWRGLIVVTNAFSVTEPVEFLRIKRIAP